MSNYHWEMEQAARVAALEMRVEQLALQLKVLQPTPLAFPTIEPDLLHAELQAWAASKKEAR